MTDFFDKSQKIGVAFCSPHRKIRLPNGEEILDTITVDWHRKRTGLSTGTNINFVEFFADGMEIGEARDGVARRCLEHDPRPEYLLFLDDDVLPEFDAFTKLFFRLKTMPQYDIACGVYCCKWSNPADPLIYAGDGGGAFWDWAVGDLLTTEQHGISSVHMGLTLIRVSLFQRMLDAGVVNDETPFYKTVKENYRDKQGIMRNRSGTEDIWFCKLASQVGAKIIVDTSVLAGHVDKQKGITWGLPVDSPPVQRAKWLAKDDQKEQVECPLCSYQTTSEGFGGGWQCPECKGTGKIDKPVKIALDLGAGGVRRQWPGYKTYTTDLRADAKPDYVQDTRWLNLPNNHFDLIASSHHLEHIPRWDQEVAWNEIYRVTKPGGKIEHTVPSIEWAAAKIQDGLVDEHVMNVLYGAQESHGYARELNLHYFGYTKDVAKALAELVGFVNVTCEDWRDHPEQGYNLIIRGEKPISDDDLPFADEIIEVSHQEATSAVDSIRAETNMEVARQNMTYNLGSQRNSSEMCTYQLTSSPQDKIRPVGIWVPAE